jgi:hypothetical protein
MIRLPPDTTAAVARTGSYCLISFRNWRAI